MNFKRRQTSSSIVGWLSVTLLLTCGGCPDTSYQAPIPDYSDMSDEMGTMDEAEEP